MSSGLASIASKALLNPLVENIVAKSRVALLVASNVHNLKAAGTGRINSDASKTVHTDERPTNPTPTYDATLSLPVAVTCTLALFGLIVSVLALRGVSGTTQSFAGSNGGHDSCYGEEAPEFDDCVDDEHNAGLVHDHDSANGGGEEPPPSPAAAPVAKPPPKGSGWLIWILMVLTALGCYYWREFSRFIWRKGVAFFTTLLTPEQRRRVYSAIAAVINRAFSSFANPVVLSVISGLVVDFLCGQTPFWIPASITALTAWSTMSALYASTFIARLALSSPLAIYNTFARAHDETHRLGPFRWLLLPLACTALAGACYKWSALLEFPVNYWDFALSSFNSAISLGWQDQLPLAQNLSVSTAPVAVSASPLM
ncbi:hypothetical protein C8F04DRAFT_107775 [Mycena alexandri]|uniref:Uncharacterized protein n=1 Tax=Mycena alexandri TaxID=1745969 RepID=A0AAD6SGA6_9AGAR|nr:hypothetical protein C8F04DRAFT_107775 [Mycena alexandri]